MATITATGMFQGNKTEVKITETDEGLVIDFDGVEFEPYEERFREQLKQHHPVAGTFYPPEESMANACEVLQFYFFDGEPKTFSVDGEITPPIPFDPDPHIIY